MYKAQLIDYYTHHHWKLWRICVMLFLLWGSLCSLVLLIVGIYSIIIGENLVSSSWILFGLLLMSIQGSVYSRSYYRQIKMIKMFLMMDELLLDNILLKIVTAIQDNMIQDLTEISNAEFQELCTFLDRSGIFDTYGIAKKPKNQNKK